MESSAKERFTISSQETILLHNDHQQQNFLHSKKPIIKKPRTIIFFAIVALLILLLILIGGTIILSSTSSKTRKPDAYMSGSSQYYCHLTPYPQLCYTSISTIINTTAIRTNPGPIFTSALQVAINELNNTATSITRELMHDSLSHPNRSLGLLKCRELVSDSVSQLNRSLGLLGEDFDFELLTYVERDDVRAWLTAATDNAGECYLGLEGMGVEEVKLGVEKANNLIANSIWLFDRSVFILFDFHNPFYIDNYDNRYHDFGYWDLACFYYVMYLFIALLYYLFWMGN